MTWNACYLKIMSVNGDVVITPVLTTPLLYNLVELSIQTWNIRVPYDAFIFSNRPVSWS